MTLPKGWVPDCVAAEIKRGKALAQDWLKNRHPYYLDPPPCPRCDGHRVVLWCGKKGMGGRKGPCPVCRVMAAKQFTTQLRMEFPDGLFSSRKAGGGRARVGLPSPGLRKAG